MASLQPLINLGDEHPRSKATGVQVTLVAGARQPPLFTFSVRRELAAPFLSRTTD